LRAPAAVARALTIFEFSEFLTDILVGHPEEIALLEQIDDRSPAGEQDLFAGSTRNVGPADDPVFAYLGHGGINQTEAMSILRRHYRRRVFVSGALDLFQLRDVFDSLDDNTAAADAALRAALAVAGPPGNFAVMGLGRLGAREFDLLSDADVLFICDEHANKEDVRRVAERLMEALTAYTREGTVFPVDARLRPHGREGELIVTPTQLSAYFRDEAQPWEALTYLKLRYTAGDRNLADRALQVVQEGISAMARQPVFDTELADVRARLERSEGAQNLKTGPGGIYDLDYLAGSLQARHQLWLAGNLAERLHLLRDHRLLAEDEYRPLTESARFLRTLEHVIRLVSGRARKWIPLAEHPRRGVQKLLWRMLGAEDSFDPEMQLSDVMRRTRNIYLAHRKG
jgi:glutamate-ammonia-ligase adenylyltransferase